MAYTQCPVCQITCHYSVGDDELWYRQRWPQLPFGALAPELCLMCFVELRSGHRVMIRDVPQNLRDQVSPGATGIVEAVADGPEPRYSVRLIGDDRTVELRRTDLHYIPGQ